MKKKVVLFGVAAGACMISVFFLLGSMGIYAEKSGTGTWTPETETADVFTAMEAETAEEETAYGEEDGGKSDEELRNLWESMYAGYLAQLEKQEGDPEYDPGIARVESDPEYTEEYLMQTGDTEYLDAIEAGIFVLKEIGRLYPKEQLESFKISRFQLHDSDYDQNDKSSGSKYQWDGYLCNGNEGFDPGYVSFQFSVNALSGKIQDISRFQPYRLDGDYWDITWTEEEVRARGRELIETCHLAEGEELDWENVQVGVRDAEQIAELREEMAEDPEFAGCMYNVLLFHKEGRPQFYLAIDWATGELAGYDTYDGNR